MKDRELVAKIESLEAELELLRIERQRPKCQTCRYWNRDRELSIPQIGECRRYAPQAVLNGQMEGEGQCPKWPYVFENEWCGEWDPSGWIVETRGYRARNRSDPGFA